MNPDLPSVIVTGASRRIGIGAAVAKTLARSGWNVATTYWRPYDEAMPWGSSEEEADSIIDEIRGMDVKAISIEANLADLDAPGWIYDQANNQLGAISALILCHCQSVNSDIESTTTESFDFHFEVNARATWLMIREFGRRFSAASGRGRIVSITSDHTVGNLPYGASKGAMDRIVLAAAHEFANKGITANVINPGGTDTGWMSEELKERIRRETPVGRVGLPSDCANLVSFLCSEEGGWINGQILYSNGGVK